MGNAKMELLIKEFLDVATALKQDIQKLRLDLALTKK